MLISGDNDVNHINHSDEVLIHGLSVVFLFKNSSVDLVNHQNGLDLLLASLSQHSFGLDRHTFDAIDDHEGTVCHSKSSSHFRGEVDVSGGVNKVDKILIHGTCVVEIVFIEQ